MRMNEDYIPAFRNNLRYNPTKQVDDYWWLVELLEFVWIMQYTQHVMGICVAKT
jgi:hypothetical protein